MRGIHIRSKEQNHPTAVSSSEITKPSPHTYVIFSDTMLSDIYLIYPNNSIYQHSSSLHCGIIFYQYSFIVISVKLYTMNSFKYIVYFDHINSSNTIILFIYF